MPLKAGLQRQHGKPYSQAIDGMGGGSAGVVAIVKMRLGGKRTPHADQFSVHLTFTGFWLKPTPLHIPMIIPRKPQNPPQIDETNL
jgi:hypothetical protein